MPEQPPFNSAARPADTDAERRVSQVTGMSADAARAYLSFHDGSRALAAHLRLDG